MVVGLFEKMRKVEVSYLYFQKRKRHGEFETVE